MLKHYLRLFKNLVTLKVKTPGKTPVLWSGMPCMVSSKGSPKAASDASKTSTT